MAFATVDLPIQEILLTDFITDIGVISNSNFLIVKDKLEDLLNGLEIDTNTLTIGTDNPIKSIRTQNIIIQDGGFVFQTGVPNQIIAKLEKNGSNQSVLNVDILNVDLSISVDGISVNDITVNDELSVNGNSTFNANVEFKTAVIESKETATYLVEFDGVDTAYARVVLSNTSRQNIYLKLSAETTLGPTQVWDGVNLNPSINKFVIYLDFDSTNPPTQNSTFTLNVVDIVENSSSISIVNSVNSSSLPLIIKSGDNLSTSNPILLHNDLDSLGFNLGINPASTNILSNAITQYGSTVTLNYIIDENNDDRLIIKNYVGLEIFI